MDEQILLYQNDGILLSNEKERVFDAGNIMNELQGNYLE